MGIIFSYLLPHDVYVAIKLCNFFMIGFYGIINIKIHFCYNYLPNTDLLSRRKMIGFLMPQFKRFM